MLRVNNNEISIIQGNTGYLSVNFEDYRYVEGDVIVFTMRKTLESSIVLQKSVNANKNITFNPEDTEDLETGMYIYDIQLQTHLDEIFTVIPPSNFNIIRGVNRNE